MGRVLFTRLAVEQAWFKLHLEGVARQDGMDYEALIYGKGEASLCGGGDDKMVRCEVS